MNRPLVLGFLVVAFLTPTSSSPKERDRSDPYLAYSALLRQTFPDGNFKQMVVARKTLSQCGVDPRVRFEFRGLLQDTLDDFLSKDKNSIVLEKRFADDLHVTLIPEEQANQISLLKDTSVWDRFYELYPKSQGIASFSQIGFSKDFRQAFVCIKNRSDWRTGMAHLVLLEWEREGWLFKGALLLWDCDAETLMALRDKGSW